MTRFLHTADWQLGRHDGRFEEEDASVLADARFGAVERLAELAQAENVDAVLVAGDVFDAQTVSDRVLHRGFNAMAGFDGPWLMLSGNHDAALAESVWTRAERLGAIPANVHCLLKPEVTCFADLGFAVLAAPLTQRHTHADLTAWFDAAETPLDVLRIGMAHGGVAGILPDDIDAANPIAPDRAATARLDYLALGDWHGQKRIDARTWYSGTPEQERFRENGAGQALLVEIAACGVEPVVASRAVGRFPWFKRAYHVAMETDLDAMLRELGAMPAMSVLDLTVTGALDLASHERLQQALGEVRGRQRSLLAHLDGLHLQPTAADLAALSADGYVGDVIEALRAAQDTGDETARAALVMLAGLLREQHAEPRS